MSAGEHLVPQRGTGRCIMTCVTQAVMVCSCLCLALQAIIAIILYGVGCNVYVCNETPTWEQVLALKIIYKCDERIVRMTI
jgi:hypothetical protein